MESTLAFSLLWHSRQNRPFSSVTYVMRKTCPSSHLTGSRSFFDDIVLYAWQSLCEVYEGKQNRSFVILDFSHKTIVIVRSTRNHANGYQTAVSWF